MKHPFYKRCEISFSGRALLQYCGTVFTLFASSWESDNSCHTFSPLIAKWSTAKPRNTENVMWVSTFFILQTVSFYVGMLSCLRFCLNSFCVWILGVQRWNNPHAHRSSVWVRWVRFGIWRPDFSFTVEPVWLLVLYISNSYKLCAWVCVEGDGVFLSEKSSLLFLCSSPPSCHEHSSICFSCSENNYIKNSSNKFLFIFLANNWPRYHELTSHNNNSNYNNEAVCVGGCS